MNEQEKEEMRRQNAALSSWARKAVTKVDLRTSRTCSGCGIVFGTRHAMQEHQAKAACS